MVARIKAESFMMVVLMLRRRDKEFLVCYEVFRKRIRFYVPLTRCCRFLEHEVVWRSVICCIIEILQSRFSGDDDPSSLQSNRQPKGKMHALRSGFTGVKFFRVQRSNLEERVRDSCCCIKDLGVALRDTHHQT